jgi:hypothetical protein
MHYAFRFTVRNWMRAISASSGDPASP